MDRPHLGRSSAVALAFAWLSAAMLLVVASSAAALPEAGAVPSTRPSASASSVAADGGGASSSGQPPVDAGGASDAGRVRGEVALIETPDGGTLLPVERPARGPTIRERNAPRSRAGSTASGAMMILIFVGAMGYYVYKRLRR